MVRVFLGPQINIEVCLTLEADTLVRVSLFSAPGFSVTADTKSPTFDKAVVWLEHYIKGQDHPFDLPLPEMKFSRDVIEFLRTIPRGTVFSYQQVAQAVGNKKAARAVGNICRTNQFPLFIPCHRVIKTSGEIGRYTPDPSLKSQLLYFEGVVDTAAGGVSCATADCST
ncbi:MAG TPA: methylated-DNA--[protein]-cysteine S-methyltransferase [Rhabdochlamydiaceae bacterium]|nr:methylated-DNA--[protein]-cysteine S-methyltransferase [Rhabdochlamydiaceae bacterium]